MSRRPLSIRSRLLLILVTVSVSVWTVAVAMSYWDARRELNELFDAQLAESAEVLLLQAAHDLGDDEEARERSDAPFLHGIDHPYAQQLHFQIWNGAGRLVYQSSHDLPPTPLVTGVSRGYADRTLHDVRWRVAVVTDPSSLMQIQLCQRYDARAGVARAIARNMFLPVAAAVPILAVLVWIATGSGIRPLGRFTRELQDRSPDNLDPVEQTNLPAELEPVGSALNGLLDRLRTRLDLERRFTADASHELRTPLAALKTHAQVALGARTEEERMRSLSQIVRGTDRMTHLVDQLLTLARVDPGMAESPERIDLAEIVRETAGSLAPMAVDKDVELDVQAAAGAIIEGNRPLVATLVRNLVDNAITYARKGGRVRLLLDRTAPGVTLRVIDTGPGMPPAARARAFERFYRGQEVREPGTGLGLSIVQRIAELHGAAVALAEAEGGGLEVTTRFPSVAPDQRGAREALAVGNNEP